MNTNKVRDRTPEELLVKKNEFLKICDILDQLNIEYFLQQEFYWEQLENKILLNGIGELILVFFLKSL